MTKTGQALVIFLAVKDLLYLGAALFDKQAELGINSILSSE